MMTTMLRAEPVAYLPALAALALAALSLPARAETRLIALCSGGTLPAGTPNRDCETACHAGCARIRKSSGRP
jgi:hypothetical protein